MNNYLLIHVIAFAVGYMLDSLIGDPHNMPHPVRAIGALIGILDDTFNKGNKKSGGVITVVLTLLAAVLVSGGLLVLFYSIHPVAGGIYEAVVTFYVLSAKSLESESMQVYDSLSNGRLQLAKDAVGQIVGRDTDVLDENGVARACVETVAENTSDGVVAPMLAAALFGPVGAIFYKAVNTMDSMIGYHSEKYEEFGKCAAKLDDVVNFLPSRIAAVFMVAATFILSIGDKGVYSAAKAFEIWRRDNRKHKSPNSAQTESVCAGALGIRLGGPAYYFGELVEKPYIGDDTREIEAVDIERANELMITTSFLCFVVCLIAFIYPLVKSIKG